MKLTNVCGSFGYGIDQALNILRGLCDFLAKRSLLSPMCRGILGGSPMELLDEYLNQSRIEHTLF